MDKFIKVISSSLITLENWIIAHPKTALAIGIFTIGFVFGLLF